MKTTKLICILSLLSLGLAACGEKEANKPTPQNLSGIYNRVYQAMKDGDVTVVQANRDPEKFEADEKRLAGPGSKLTGDL